jgi:hypothetical protein
MRVFAFLALLLLAASALAHGIVMRLELRELGQWLFLSPSLVPKRFEPITRAAMLGSKKPRNLAIIGYNTRVTLAARRAVTDETFAQDCSRDYHSADGYPALRALCPASVAI